MCIYVSQHFFLHTCIYFSFDSLEDQSNLVLKARNIIEMTHHSRPVFEMNVRQAYDIMLKQKGEYINGWMLF